MKFFLTAIFLASKGSFTLANGISCNANDPQSVDGTCNNVANPTNGAEFTSYRRGPEGTEYEDGVKVPAVRANARTISNRVGAEVAATAGEDPIPHNMLAVLFGQFINHDFEDNDKENLFKSQAEGAFAEDLTVDDPDDFFCFFPPGVNRCDPALGPYYLEYRTSAGKISSTTGQFEVDNRGTSYLDLGPIYGNNVANATVLRAGQDGMLLTEDYSGFLRFGPNAIPWSFSDMPPSRATTGLNTDTLARYPDNEILTQGDFRLNNNVALAGFHTLFTREHNYQAQVYQTANPAASDEEIFQAARRRNIAQFQKIAVEDYFLAEFGSYFTNIIGPYGGYDSTVDATTGSAFAGAAFRYGHSTLRGYKPLTECSVVATLGLPPGSELPNIGQIGGPFNIFGVLFLAGNVGFETVMRGLLATRLRPVDTKVDDGIRNVLLPGGQRRQVGIDVFSFDIQRGRINGVPNYDRLRGAYHPDGSMYGSPGCGVGLANNSNDDPLVCFIRLVSGGPPGQATTEETTLATTLRDLYGKVNNIDGLVGMLSEPHVSGTSFGETLGRIVADQYQRARDGDRFWYENVYGSVEQAEVKSTTMKTLLERNFNLANLPDNIFFAPNDYAGDLTASCP